jgi:hypothetical protein
MTQPSERGTIAIPEAPPGREPTDFADGDRAVTELAGNAKTWLDTPPAELVGLLDRLVEQVLASADEWIAACCAAKGIDPDSPLAGEEWLAGVAPTARYLRLLRRSLADIAAGRRPGLPGHPSMLADGRTALPVLPVDKFDRALLTGFSAQVRLQPGVTAEAARSRAAAAYFGAGGAGVSLVLGAGNVSAIPIMDTLDRLFIARHPVVLKMNPVNDYLGPIFERALGELVRRGVLRIVYGGGDLGAHLVAHPDVADVHVTGSDKTFDAIVFGPGEQGARRKGDRRPQVDKPVTGELGNVTPVIVVPGPWSARDIAFQARNIASMLTNNAGFNCIAVRVVITQAGWPGRRALLDALRGVLRAAPQRDPYYPGALDRWQRFLSAHPEAERYGSEAAGCLPWTLIPGLSPDAPEEIAFDTESFNGVFAEVALGESSTIDYLAAAVRFCNERLWGTLGASLIVHPRSLREPGVRRAVDAAVDELRYGTVAVNHWSALGFTLGSSPWGAYPGHPTHDIGSGTGFVHNSFMLDPGDVEKTVLTGPFRTPIAPAWFLTNRAAADLGERFARMNARPSWGRMPALVAAALRG